MLKLSDEALCAAKTGGRNRVVAAPLPGQADMTAPPDRGDGIAEANAAASKAHPAVQI